MNINRHNYETFFLLYVDNELSAAERKAVEQFVMDNTDLRAELQLLLGTKLPGEAINFNAKSLLYKNEIDQDTLQENFLLHLDNELDPVAAEKLIRGIASNSSLKQEWEILQRTKLDANEKIVFENKGSLYRHKKDRVIAMRFWRIAVAAAILFAGLFFGISLLTTNNKMTGVETAAKIKNPSTQKPANNSINTNNKSLDSLKTAVRENIASVNDQEKKEQRDQNNIVPSAVIKPITAKDKNIVASFHQKEQKDILPKIPLENINKEKSNEITTAVVLHKNNGTVIKNQAPDEIASVSMKDKITAPKTPVIDYSVTATPDSYATTAVLNETDPANDNKILYMNEQNITRSKIGGLFRRVKRVIERNTNIKTGNGVRIAGFEIAVK